MNILLVDDHAIVRDGLRRLLATLAPRQVFEAANGREALKIVSRHPIDLIILDLNLPELGGLEILKRLARLGQTPVLILSMHAEPLYVKRAMDAGARGYVSKSATPDELVKAVQRVAAGGRYIENELAQAMILHSEIHSLDQLSSRDLEILRLLARGRSLGEIAAALGLGYKTVANLCTQLKARVGAARNADLVRIAIEAGIT